MSDIRLISIVVIGRNEGKRLERCLTSVLHTQQRGFATELIYVDSGSSDDSVAVAARLGARTLQVQSSRPTAALGRNAGWRAARGELVLFLDGDTVLAEDFVAYALPVLDDAAVAIVWGHRRELYPKASFYNRVLDLDWIYAPGDTAFCGGDALFRRSVLEQTGGFDETLIAGEEPELCRRISALGSRIVHVDHAMTGHDLAMTNFAQYWRRAKRAGHAFAEVSERFAESADPFWMADARRNRRRAVMLLSLVTAGVVSSLALFSPWPFAVTASILSLLALRTAAKARWKTRDRVALLLYGVHSHLQQIPIFFGQMAFFLDRSRGRRALLVEYK